MNNIMSYKIFENTSTLNYNRQKQDLRDHIKYLYVFRGDNSEIIATTDIYSYYSKPNIWVISNLYTTEEHRKGGIAKQIFELLENVVLKEFGVRDFRLWVLKDSWMRKWYESLGFRYVRKKDKDNVWLKKILKN